MATELEKRNADAVMQALNAQNAKLEAFRIEIEKQGRQLQALVEQFHALKAEQMNDLVAKFGSGPTA